jgi:hypothetical protein
VAKLSSASPGRSIRRTRAGIDSEDRLSGLVPISHSRVHATTADSSRVDLSPDEWRSRWLPGLRQYGLLVGINWSAQAATCYDLAPDDVERDLAARQSTLIATCSHAGVLGSPGQRCTGHLGGFAVVDVSSRAEALKWAAKIAVACRTAAGLCLQPSVIASQTRSRRHEARSLQASARTASGDPARRNAKQANERAMLLRHRWRGTKRPRCKYAVVGRHLGAPMGQIGEGHHEHGHQKDG